MEPQLAGLDARRDLQETVVLCGGGKLSETKKSDEGGGWVAFP